MSTNSLAAPACSTKLRNIPKGFDSKREGSSNSCIENDKVFILFFQEQYTTIKKDKLSHRKFASIENHDFIRVNYGIQSMSNGKYRAIFEFLPDNQLYEKVSPAKKKFITLTNLIIMQN